MMTIKLLVPTALLLTAVAMTPLLAGCGGSGSSSASSAPVLSRSVTTAGGLRLTLAEDRATVTVGQSVTYTLTMTNITDKPVPFIETPCSTQIIDDMPSSVTVTTAAGETYEEFGNDGGICGFAPQPLQQMLAPGETLSGMTTSQSKLAVPGTYTQNVTIYGALRTDDATYPLTPLTFGDLKIVVTK